MKLTFDEDDLKPESRDNATSTIHFEDLSDKAQAEIKAVGRGTFFRNKGTSQEIYNVIYSPEEYWGHRNLRELP